MSADQPNEALEILMGCPCCCDDAELVGAPGPNEPTDEYICGSCGCNFTSDGAITFVSDKCARAAATSLHIIPAQNGDRHVR